MGIDITDYFSVGDLIYAFSSNVFKTDYKESICSGNLLVNSSSVLSGALAETPKFIGV